MQSENIKVTSQEGTEFEINKKYAELSKLLKGAMEDFKDDENITVPLGEMDEATTRRVIEFLEHFKGEAPPEIEKPLKSAKMIENTDEWSANFVDSLSLEDVADLAIAGNFMEIPCLLDLTCAKVASIAKDKTEEELFKEYGITEPFTEEEKQKILDENPWLELNPEI